MKEELAELKRQLEQLHASASDNRRRNIWIETLQAKRRALSTSIDIRKRLRDALQDQERTGNFDGEALAGLVDEAGKKTSSGSSASWRGIPPRKTCATHSGKRRSWDTTTRPESTTPSKAEKLRRNAEQAFRRKPTVQNFRTLEQADRLCIQWGKAPPELRGMRQVRPGTVHTVGTGDTPAGISQRYFGSPGYRAVIYSRKNADVIGDPSTIKLGTTLRIS